MQVGATPAAARFASAPGEALNSWGEPPRNSSLLLYTGHGIRWRRGQQRPGQPAKAAAITPQPRTEVEAGGTGSPA